MQRCKVLIVKGVEMMVIQSLQSENDVDFVIKLYSDMIYRLANAHVKSLANADDIYQDVFLRYIKEIKKGITFESEEHRKAWLIRVTINCCKSFNTSAWFRRTVPLEDNLNESYDKEIDDKVDFHNALMQIPQKYRSVIHLFYYEQLSIEQISTALDIKQSTVRTQLVRARALLKEILKGEYFDEE